MLTKSRIFKHGNVVAQSIKGSAHNIASAEIPRPVNASYETTKNRLDETLTIPSINQQRKVEPFDTTTGIISNSPEIIAFSNFIPVYDGYNELNEFGQSLQAKQDSFLIRASKAVQDLIVTPEFTFLKNASDANASLILEYLEGHVRGIEEFLSHFSLIRKKLDFRYPIDINTLKLTGILPPDYNLNDPESQAFYANLLPLTVDEILNEPASVTNTWTPTKIWLQCCLELKETLANGMVQSFLSDGTISSVDPGNYSYYDPFSINPARSSLVKKFGFNDKQIIARPLFNLLRGDTDNLGSIVSSVAAAFRPNSIFNQKIFSDISSIDESIAKLSHILCKEYVYSTKMRTEIVSDYGYPFSFGGKNVNVWNHLIGQVGADITDISSTPLGGGKSLTSLAQSIEPGGTEVLSFEDRYINDNVGTVRPNVVITPGTFYYLESSINPTSSGFDVTRLNRYLTRLNSATNMLKMVKEDLAFKQEIPYSSVLNKVTNIAEMGVTIDGTLRANIDTIKDQKQYEIKDALSSPIGLLRHIEKNIFGGSGLLRRSVGPMLWTNKNTKNIDSDVSALLISLAIDNDDAELQALMFLHQLYATSNMRNTMTESDPTALPPPGESVVKIKIVDAILQRIKELLDTNTVNSHISANAEIAISLSTIREALLSSFLSPNLKILNQIGLLLVGFDENFDTSDPRSRTSGRFFLEQTRNVGVVSQIKNTINSINVPTDKKSSYSGIQKTLYLTALFKLCCLMVHAANPERLNSIKKPNMRVQADDKVVVRKIRNAVIGVFFAADEINQGNTNFSLLENDSNGGQSFGLSKMPNMAPQANKVFNSSIPGIKKISSNNFQKQKIGVFELPASLKSGIKVFGSGGQNKKFDVFTNMSSNSALVALQYDDIIVKAESMLDDYDKKMTKFVDRFYTFVYGLKSEFTSLKNNLQLKSGLYGRTLTTLSRQIGNPALTRALFSEEQLLLARSKFEDYMIRLRGDYISPIRDSAPHFSNLKGVNSFEYTLPIEDVHLVSWNTFLKSFLSSGEYVEGAGSNKKIISIGIPQKLHRRMRVNSSNLSGLAQRNSLIKMCIYRVNAFLPDVIYKPKMYLFDLKLFPTRILGNFVSNGFSVSPDEDVYTSTNYLQSSQPAGAVVSELGATYELPPLLYNSALSRDVIKFIPHWKSVGDYRFKLVDSSEKLSLRDSDYSFLSSGEFNQVFDNHSISFLLEEYLRYVTDMPFDEQKYQQYDVISKKSQSQFSKFVSEFTKTSNLKSTTDNFYNDETILSSQFTIIKSLILPKKFDRVFHIIFDPDDFEIDERTSKKTIEKYIGIGGDVASLSKNEKDEPTFDKYYVALETHEGNDAS